MRCVHLARDAIYKGTIRFHSPFSRAPNDVRDRMSPVSGEFRNCGNALSSSISKMQPLVFTCLVVVLAAAVTGDNDESWAWNSDRPKESRSADPRCVFAILPTHDRNEQSSRSDRDISRAIARAFLPSGSFDFPISFYLFSYRPCSVFHISVKR